MRSLPKPMFQEVCARAEQAGYKVLLHTGKLIKGPRHEEDRRKLGGIELQPINDIDRTLAESIRAEDLEGASERLLDKLALL